MDELGIAIFALISVIARAGVTLWGSFSLWYWIRDRWGEPAAFAIFAFLLVITLIEGVYKRAIKDSHP